MFQFINQQRINIHFQVAIGNDSANMAEFRPDKA